MGRNEGADVWWRRRDEYGELCYCDQAHLIREFRFFSGLTPLGYMAKRGPFLNYLEV